MRLEKWSYDREVMEVYFDGKQRVRKKVIIKAAKPENVIVIRNKKRINL